MLITPAGGELQITHLPLLLERESGSQGTLLGHVARANPHARHLDRLSTTAIYSGPHAFISPGWYEAEHVVPTWNYVAVHVTGTTQIVSDRDELWELVRSLTDHYESGMPNPWTLPESTAIDRMLDQIVGFRLQIERIEGKWKLNQNHSRERRLKVIARLREQGDANSLAMARLMEVSLEDSAD